MRIFWNLCLVYATEMQELRIFRKYFVFYLSHRVEGWRENPYFVQIKYIAESCGSPFTHPPSGSVGMESSINASRIRAPLALISPFRAPPSGTLPEVPERPFPMRPNEVAGFQKQIIFRSGRPWPSVVQYPNRIDQSNLVLRLDRK
jgi:hypothetical protein